MYKPCLETPNKRSKDFDASLCIVCQKNVDKPKRGRPKKVDFSSFDVFKKVFKILEDRICVVWPYLRGNKNQNFNKLEG